MLKSWIRNLRMKKYASKRPTGFLPLREIRTALVVLDGTEPECFRYSCMIEAFLQGYGVDVSFIFLDLRKTGRDTVVYACGREVINRKDINWLGIPKGISSGRGKASLFSGETDLFINLAGSDDFTSRFISSAASAGFKVGISAYPGNPFDLVITDSDGGEDAVHHDTPAKITAMCNLLDSII